MRLLYILILLALPSLTNAALPDIITDPATRDVIEYLDAKVSKASAGVSSSTIANLNIAGVKIGNNRVYGPAFTASANDLHFSYYISQKSTIITKLQASFHGADGSSRKCVFGIYSDNSLSPDILLAQTSEYSTSSNTQGSDILLQLTSTVNLTDGLGYWLALHCNYAMDLVNLSVNATDQWRRKYRTIPYSSTMPNPAGTITGTSGGLINMGGY